VRLDRVLVVDDEAPARRHLARMLHDLADIGDVLEARSVSDAVAVLTRQPVQAIFLDVQMPLEEGFALFDRCAVLAPVIFVTAHHRHAVRAFEVNALDYVLKPIARDRLATALGRLATTQAPGPAPRPAPALADTDVVWIRERDRQTFVPLAAILCITAADDYTELHFADRPSRLSASPMREWVTRLPPSFLRIHRSTIIALVHVIEVRHAAEGASVVMQGMAAPMRVGRTYLAELKARIAAIPR
jgi:two-component system LytT family response regulator